MLGLTIQSSTNTNQLQLNIPDELIGIDLQIIIIPADKNNQQIEFFSNAELAQLSSTNLSTLKEDNEDYTKMVGEIHLADIYFTNASTAKVRPVLLLKLNSFNDFLYLPLTSNTGVKGIKIDNSHLQNGYLPKVSIVVYEKIGVIAPTLLIKKIATLNNDTCHQIINELVRFLQIR